jgi:hypothetical protein
MNKERMNDADLVTSYKGRRKDEKQKKDGRKDGMTE